MSDYMKITFNFVVFNTCVNYKYIFLILISLDPQFTHNYLSHFSCTH